MRKAMFVGAGLLLFGSAGVQAQSAAQYCPPTLLGTPQSNAACTMALDVFRLMAPQLGLALTGGNATLGRGSTLGPGHFSIGLRGNVFKGDVPQVQDFPSPGSSATPSTLPAKSQIVGLPTADAAIGIFGGVPLGITSVGGIDLLVSASYVPSYGDVDSDVRVKPDQNLRFGYGVRVGLLQESIIVPGVAFTFLKRDLPKTTISGTSPNLDVKITDASVKTSAYRVVASKNLLLFGIAAGVGQDRYDQSAIVEGTAKISGGTYSRNEPFAQKLSRTNYFLDLSLNLPIFKLIGEVGQVTGGTVDTYNAFETGRADKARTYGSVGFRLGL